MNKNFLDGMGMGNMGEKMMSRFFRKVDNVVWDLMTGKIGVATADGITSISGEGEDAQIEINMLDQFGMAVPAFAQNTPMSAVAIGDLIYQGNSVKGWVTGVVRAKVVPTEPATEDAAPIVGDVKRFQLMTPGGTTTTWTPPKVSMIGFDSGVMVLRSLMNMLPGGAGGLSNMQSMMMPMMMMGGDIDMESMMPMMLMMQMGGGVSDADGKSNPMGGMGMGGGMMQTMMMMNMMKTMGGSKNGKPGFFDQEN